MRCKHALGGAGEHGFVLIPVLWAISLLSLVALLLTKTVIMEVRLKGALIHQAEAEYLADGAARLAVSYLASSSANGQTRAKLSLKGKPESCFLSGGFVTIRAFGAGGQVDLNAAPVETIELLLTAVGESKDRAASLAAAIVDFREGGDKPSAGGASKAAQYQQAGLLHGPKNASFSSVSELEQVIGIDGALYARLRPFVTVYSRRPTIDADMAQGILLSSPIPVEVNASTAPASAILLQVRVAHPLGGIFIREAVIQLASRAASGFLIRQWGRLDPDEDFTPPQEPADVSCFELLSQ